jgi:phytoene/squalene synthetase
VSGRELDAAGITDPALRASYEACRRLNASHGKTYYLATLLLPAWKRPYVHALYGFARYADEIVDDLASTLSDAEKADWLVGWGEQFLRDVGEDLRRGRVYLPMEDLAAFGVTREHLEHGVVDGPVRRLLAFEVARTREIYRTAAHGVRLLHPTSRPCIETALALYGGILDEIEAADYAVLGQRVSVGAGRRAAVAGPGLVRAWAARR